MLVFLPAGVAEPVGARRFWLKLVQNKFFGSGSFSPDPDRTFFPESGSAKNRILEKNGKKLYVQVQKYV